MPRETLNLLLSWLQSLFIYGHQDGGDVPEDHSATHLYDTPARPRAALGAARPGKPKFLWVLDAGHGPLTSGKRSPEWMQDEKPVRFLEYEFNRDIVDRIAAILKERGHEYLILIDPNEKVGNFLAGRVWRANTLGWNMAKKKRLMPVFLSVHSNAGPTNGGTPWVVDRIKGVETWFYHGNEKGRAMAGAFQRNLLDSTGLFDRKVKSRPKGQFYVLRRTTMPAVLTETGFYNNAGEVKHLMDDQFRGIIARAHANAIQEIELTIDAV